MIRFVLMRGHGKVCTHEGSWSGLYSVSITKSVYN